MSKTKVVTLAELQKREEENVGKLLAALEETQLELLAEKEVSETYFGEVCRLKGEIEKIRHTVPAEVLKDYDERNKRLESFVKDKKLSPSLQSLTEDRRDKIQRMIEARTKELEKKFTGGQN